MTAAEGARATVLAPAKVNLALRVLRKRPDGYHEIDTLFQAVDLCDEVEVELTPEGLSLEVVLESAERASPADLGRIEENLAYRAAAKLLAGVGSEAGAQVRLAKRIPVGAGLGGGSSDAAAVLRALAALLGGVDPERLRAIGAELGSDVPFFLGESALARGRGRGEVLEPLAALPPIDLVLVSPPVHVSTGEAYEALGLRSDDESRVDGPSPAADLSSWDDLPDIAKNDFQAAMELIHPSIPRALHALRTDGALVALMTGSGSTCYGVFRDAGAAARASEKLRQELGWACVAARTLDALPPVHLS